MKIDKIKIKNFRNYENLELSFSDNKNIIIGNNGIGKTNIVEAIYYLALTKSFRTNDDQLLIKNNTENSIIEAKINNRINNQYKLIINKNGKKIFIDGNPINKLNEYVSKVNIIIFSIEDLKLIKDNPQYHRKLINMEISTFNSEYVKLLIIYNKYLKHRNSYLKDLKIHPNLSNDYLDILTDNLIKYGLQINKIRNEYINEINKYLPSYFLKSVKKGLLNINYISSYNNKTKDEIFIEYKKNYIKELKYGETILGIHRDDYIFEINQKNIKNYLSEGEQKSAIIAFKLSEIKYCEKIKKTTPIVILDDLFSALDNKKINILLKNFKKTYQLFITTTDLKKVDQKFLNNCRVIKITNKKLEVKDYE